MKVQIENIEIGYTRREHACSGIGNKGERESNGELAILLLRVSARVEGAARGFSACSVYLLY